MELVMITKRKGEEIPTTNSRNVAEKFDKKHFHVTEAIQNLECSKEFWNTNYRGSNYEDSRGKTQLEYRMTKDGFIFLVMGFKGKKAAKFKEEYIGQFNKMEKFIKEKQSDGWKDTRQISKGYSKSFNDAVYEFDSYAKEQGSKNPNRMSTFNSMVNKELGVSKGQKDMLDHIQMAKQILFQNKVTNVLNESISNQLHYKPIYTECKETLKNMKKALE